MFSLREDLPIPARILLVDDDSIFRSEFRECFEEYGVKDASNGEEALSVLKRPNEIDLVFLDVRMSGMNGIEVLEKVRQLSPDVRIVMLTGYGSKDVAIEALRGRADDYVEKPLDIETTKQIIENFLGTKRSGPAGNALDSRAKIERVKEYVQRNILKKITLQDAAQSVSLSPKYLSRIFNEHAGVGFNEYRLALKIKQAKLFLEKTAYNIDQISDKLGYMNSESFIRQFKKLTGQTPTAYRKKHNPRSTKASKKKIKRNKSRR